MIDHNDLSQSKDTYSDETIVHLEDLEHIRLRPGMYIGKLGDGSSADDGIYVLLKEIIDNSIDEFRMKYGSSIDITMSKRSTQTVFNLSPAGFHCADTPSEKSTIYINRIVFFMMILCEFL